MYEQIDGVAMGSPLRPVMDNIFVGCHERQLFENSLNYTAIYFILMTLLYLFSSHNEADSFFSTSKHSLLLFTVFSVGRETKYFIFPGRAGWENFYFFPRQRL